MGVEAVDADPVVDPVGRDAEPGGRLVDAEASVDFLGERPGSWADGFEVPERAILVRQSASTTAFQVTHQRPLRSWRTSRWWWVTQ
ncbi:hypothetical protein [Streptomyces sp. CA-106110]|uniref:hypothetical protein n=1 Tax=Streptomyces sp. CA-106110 TaxID=3240044 RepID=UPI003D948929